MFYANGLRKDFWIGVVLWVLPKISEHFFWKTPFGDCLCFFCSLRWPRPQKLFPWTFLILNIFERNTMKCLRTALCGGPSQLWLSWFIANRASDMSEMLLEIESSRPAVFCKNEILLKLHKFHGKHLRWNPYFVKL